MLKNKNKLQVKFWGVRGSIPTPHKDFLKYGGNTPCVEVRYNDTIFIFDAGTGIKNLGMHLVQEFKNKEVEINLFISHTHWDHIQGFPFFSPIYNKNFKINIYGGHSITGIKELLSGQMSMEYFPVSLEELPAELNYYDIDEFIDLTIKEVKIKYTHLMHPALSLGFRLICDDKIFVYATDNEIISDKNFPEYNESNLGALIKNADILVAECQYTDKEYESHIGWGHSGVESVVKLCNKLNVKNMYTFHHDPYHKDQDLDKIVKIGKKESSDKLNVFGSKEGLSVVV